MRILVTGGAGYIGSHTCVVLLQEGHKVAIIDSFENAHPAVLPRIARLGGHAPMLIEADLRDAAQIRAALAEGIDGVPFDAVIHFAGRKAVGDSVADPIGYWHTNVTGTIHLLEAMAASSTRTLVFSSTCTVHGDAVDPPWREDHPTQPINPYSTTKLAVEQMLDHLATADPEWRISVLRYFNPIGAHPSGEIGEDPLGVPTNLLPFITQVAVGRREELQVHGNDYPTADGTCIRDYIHVMDLARGHVRALDYVAEQPGYHVHNLGTETGCSVLEMIAAFERATGLTIPHRIGPRRPGDSPAIWADAAKARAQLGWKPQFDIETMCRDAWNWQQRNPNGYGNEPER